MGGFFDFYDIKRQKVKTKKYGDVILLFKKNTTKQV